MVSADTRKIGKSKMGLFRMDSKWVLKQKIMLSEANYKIIQPLVYTSRIFAICPVSFTKSGSYYQIRYSPLLVLYSYAFVTAFGVGTVLGVMSDIDRGDNAIRMKSMKNRYISICDMFVVFIIALYGIISIPYKMRKFVRMLDIWSQVDSIIPITKYQKYRKNSIIFLSATILATTSLFTFDIFIYCYHWSHSNYPTAYIQSYFSYYMLYFILFFQEIFFWHLVFFIYIRLFSLNESLAREKHNLEKGLKKFFVLPYSLNNGNISEDKYGGAKSKNSSGSNQEKFGINTADRIHELLRIYEKIRESVDVLNCASSYGIVLIMMSCLLHLVVTPYFLLIEIFKNNASMVFILLQGVWLLAHIGRLLIIVEPCQRCINEYKITTNLISEMVLLDFDEDTKNSLKDFASIFSYADINFHACGFFDINRYLLTTVTGAVSTYLVILFQFNGNGG